MTQRPQGLFGIPLLDNVCGAEFPAQALFELKTACICFGQIPNMTPVAAKLAILLKSLDSLRDEHDKAVLNGSNDGAASIYQDILETCEQIDQVSQRGLPPAS